MNRKKVWYIGGLILGTIVAVAVFISWPSKRTPAVEEQSVHIAYSRLRISLPIFVAAERGLFKKHGINAVLDMYDTAQPMAQALVEGKIDIAGYTAMPITYNGMIRADKKLYFISTMLEDPAHRISYLLRKKTGANEQPSIRTVADLRGKRIGILPTIAYKAWLEAILKAEGVEPTEVTIQQVEPTLQPQTLASGGVDALFSNDPPATAAIINGVAEFINPYVECPRVLGNPFPFASFNVSKDWGDSNPELLQRLIAALDEAIIYINEHPKDANQCMRPYLPEVFKTHIDQYPEARYLPSWESSEKTFSSLAAEYKRMGIIPKDIDMSGLIYRGKPVNATEKNERGELNPWTKPQNKTILERSFRLGREERSVRRGLEHGTFATATVWTCSVA